MAEGARIGIIGCGKQAEKHIAGLRTWDAPVAIVAFDVNPERLLGLARSLDVEPAPSLEAIYDDPAVDALVIATPTPYHHDQIMGALAAGKHVFCEKPLCEQRDQAESLRAAAARADKVLQVGFVYRQVPAFKALRRALTAAEPPLGRPVTAWLRIGGRGAHAAWKHRRESGGGVVNEMLVHMLDLAQWLFGRLHAVRWLELMLLRPTRTIAGEALVVDADDFALLSCESASGAHLVIQADLLTPAFRQYLEVQGENGSFFGSIQAELPCQFHLVEAAGGMAAGRHDLAREPVNLFEAQMREFLAHVAAGPATTGYPGAADTVRLLEILETRP